ncbi:putative RNA methyltransferase [Pseudonocardia phyllosphaerae]|uniref:putative RNA methyltransferase n=1 Tax=Pseudonocardia phyllosphaerae TaxID=3390502 RepID=UPI00397AD9D7
MRCPHCAAEPLYVAVGGVTCPGGHTFDVARQGYVSLLTGNQRRHRGDTAAMVAARMAFLEHGHYRPLLSTLTALTVEHAPADGHLAVDLAGGTGYYLGGVLDGLPDRWGGVVTDLSTAALRRAARAHPRAAAVGVDVWQPLPLRSRSAGVVLNVFGPRNVGEIERVLASDGILVVAGAAPDHLRELRRLAGTIGVDPRKRERLDAVLKAFEPVDRQPVTWRLALEPAEVEKLVLMGPNAHHVDPVQLRAALDVPWGLVVATASIDVAVYRLRRPPGADR